MGRFLAGVAATAPRAPGVARGSGSGRAPGAGVDGYGWVVARDDEAQILELDGQQVRITSPDKVLFAEHGETKRDLVDYYVAVAAPLLRTMGGRPALMQRFNVRAVPTLLFFSGGQLKDQLVGGAPKQAIGEKLSNLRVLQTAA